MKQSFLILFLLLSSVAQAELAPEQVLVLANAEDATSVSIADYYAERRFIPKKNVIALSLPTREKISRAEYEKLLITPLRQELEKRDIASSIRAFVSIRGVPLKISQPESTIDELEASAEAQKRLDQAEAEIERQIAIAQEVAGEKSSPLPNTSAERFRAEFSALIQRASEAIKRAPAERKAGLEKKLADVLQNMGGENALAGILRPTGSGEQLKQSKLEIENLKRKVQSSVQRIVQLERIPSAKNREQMYSLTREALGNIGVKTLANKQAIKVKHVQASSALDSELSLLWWDRGSYPLSGKLPNPLYYGLKGVQMSIPILMGSRLDGPTENGILAIIDQTIEAETSGLAGKAYVDTRGLEYKRSDPFSVYDQSLNDLGWLLRNNSDYDLSMDASSLLIESAKDTALYAGWYRLRNYKDVFTYKPGAIAWHIASEEAVSLRDPAEKGWCKNAIERGAAVCIGATEEPYLQSFPKPLSFFGLLFTGKYSLVESFYLSSPTISWRVILIGDPLYNPWKDKGFVELDDLKLRNVKNEELTTLPLPPSSLPMNDPLAVRAQLSEQKAKAMRSLSK